MGNGCPYEFKGFDDGPFERSFNEGRHIFSSGRSLVGAGGWGGWGLARTDYRERNRLSDQKQSLQKDFDDYWKKHPVKLSKQEEGEIAWEWERTENPKKRKEEIKQQQIKSFMSHHEKRRRNESLSLMDRYG